MRTLRLTEYTTTAAVPLASDERDALRTQVRTMSITPSVGTADRYDLNPGGTVGVLQLGDLQVEMAPRLPIERVLFLVSYALDPKRWKPAPAAVAPDDRLLEAIVPAFVHHVSAALRRGLLLGYRSLDDTSTTLRGQIRLADQLRARPGRHLPIELTYDEFTVDILENRLIFAAVERLLRLRLRNAGLRASLLDLREQFASVTPVNFRRGRIPDPRWTRLNGRYRPAIGLARLILDGGSTDVATGAVTSSGVLLDMAAVFENFVVEALRESLAVTARAFPQGMSGRFLSLDVGAGIPLKPDLSWWHGDACVFVGDCKYKRATADGVPNADLYQLLAYCTALDLDEGVLVYAAGEHDAGTYTVRHAGKRLTIHTLDLAGSPEAVLAQIDALAELLRACAGRRLRRGVAA